MDTISYRTDFPNAQEVQHDWVVIDATDQVLGRLCAKVAKLLRGKYKPSYSPNMECGDNVIIINADKIVLTGKKMTDRIYLNYTYPIMLHFLCVGEIGAIANSIHFLIS